MTAKQAIVPVERIERMILVARGHKVILDSDLADLYAVPTKRLNEQVKRNIQRFPNDFCFQLSKEEYASLRSQSATSKGRGGRRYPPYVFTEHGTIMAANVINSPQAIDISVYVVRAFIKLREELASHKLLARKISRLERQYDEQFRTVFVAIRQLMGDDGQRKKKRKIGFESDKAK